MNVTYTWDQGQLRMWQGPSVQRAVTRALTKSLRDGLRTLKTESSRYVRSRKRLKVSRVNKGLPTYSSGKDISDLQAVMRVSGAPIPLVEYPYNVTSQGVSVAVNVGKRMLIRSAFEATMRSGHTGIFRREGKSRLPIRELYSTKISDVFNDAGMLPAVLAKTMTSFGKTFDRVLPLELDKLK